MVVSVLLYLILCLIAAILGRRTRVGFWGTLALSILFTPIWVFIAILCFSSAEPGEQRDPQAPRLD